MAQAKRTKQFYEQRAADEMARHFLTADYDTRQKLALAGRMLAREEHESGLAGQITARAGYWPDQADPPRAGTRSATVPAQAQGHRGFL